MDGQRDLVVTLKNVKSGGYLAVDSNRNLITDSKSVSTSQWRLESFWLWGILRMRLRNFEHSNEYLATGRNSTTWSQTDESGTWPPVETDWIFNNYFPGDEAVLDRYSVVSQQGGEYLYEDGGQIFINMINNTATNGVWIDEMNQWNIKLVVDSVVS